jgi:hypothetical protein
MSFQSDIYGTIKMVYYYAKFHLLDAPIDFKYNLQYSGRSLINTGLVGSNPTRSMDVCLRLFCLRCPVQTVALRQADPPSKESYHLED